MDQRSAAFALVPHPGREAEHAYSPHDPSLKAFWATNLRTEIAESWCRCHDRYGVSSRMEAAPEAERHPRYSLDDATLLTDIAGRAAACEAELEAEEALLVLADSRARIVGVWGAGAALLMARECNMTPRSCWSERAVGTNALGLALVTDGLTTVSKGEHWVEGLADWYTTAEALRDQAIGRPIAAVMVASTKGLPPSAATWIARTLGCELHAAVPAIGERYLRAHPPLGSSTRRSDPYAFEPLEPTACPPVPGIHVHPVDVGTALHSGEHDEPVQLPVSRPDASFGRSVVGVKDHRQILFSANELLSAEASGRTVWLTTELGRFRCATDGLERLEQRLNDPRFMRVHRRYLVNLTRVREVERKDGGELALTTDRGFGCVPVSRRRAGTVSRALGL